MQEPFTWRPRKTTEKRAFVDREMTAPGLKYITRGFGCGRPEKKVAFMTNAGRNSPENLGHT